MRLAIDIDGVLANLGAGFTDALVRTTGKTLVPQDHEPKVWDWPQACGYTEEEVAATWTAVHQDSSFWANLPALPGAERFLDNLWRRVATENWIRKRSIEVYFLTKRDGARAKDQTEDWLSQHGFAGKPPTVLLVRGSKGPLSQSLGITHVVDDKPENLDEIRDATPGLKSAVLWMAAYNRHRHESAAMHDLTLASSFDQLEALWSLR